jgi:hypothetical protein
MIPEYVTWLIAVAMLVITVLFLLWIGKIDKASKRAKLDNQWTDEEIEKLGGRKYTALEINKITEPYSKKPFVNFDRLTKKQRAFWDQNFKVNRIEEWHDRRTQHRHPSADKDSSGRKPCPGCARRFERFGKAIRGAKYDRRVEPIGRRDRRGLQKGTDKS